MHELIDHSRNLQNIRDMLGIPHRPKEQFELVVCAVLHEAGPTVIGSAGGER